MRIIARKTLKVFWEKRKDCEQQLKSWHQEATESSWDNSNDIKKDFPTASILGDNRIVFNVKGNHYRLIVKISYTHQMVWIRFIGSHTEYNKIDATKI